mgnify:CR=1 FL=1
MESIKLGFGPCLFVTMTALLVGACVDEDPNSLKRRGGAGDDPSAEGADEGSEALPEALQCTVKPEGRSYVLFDGTRLEASRVNENAGVNRARIKPYAVMATEYERVLGLVPEGIKTAGGSFDDPPERWYAEGSHSGVSINAIFEISFEGCLAWAKAAPELADAPTDESATAECTKLMRKAWSRTPSPDEIAGCVDLAVNKLASQSDPARRWAYVCASVLSSSHFLTF